jgi:hypothetical protein
MRLIRATAACARTAPTIVSLVVIGHASTAIAQDQETIAADVESAAVDTSWWSALRQSDLRYSFRYRLEDVEEGDLTASRDATASTLRSRVALRTAAWRRWSAALELDNLARVGGDGYNSTRNGRTDRALVADPQGTELNVATLQFTGVNHVVTVGRQRLNLDDERFVGGVNWRQNEQTFDAVSARLRSGRIDATYGFVANANRIVGPQAGSPPGDLHGASHLLNVQLDAGAAGGIAAFAYWLDFDNAPALSTATAGLRWSKSFPLVRGWRVAALGSFAVQQDAGANPLDYDTNYWKLEAAFKRSDWAVTFGAERLDGSERGAGRSFQTPLGTVHLFQGWADRFVTTPPEGIDDRYVAVSGALGPVKVAAAWHQFEAAAGGSDYGAEWNALANWAVHSRVDLLLKYADYSAESFATDIRKVWFQVFVSF